MKPRHRFFPACLVLALTVPAVADTIYSNLQDTAIPTDFTGVTVTISGGTLNPFFGGVGVANNNLFQPARTGTGNLDSLANLTVGSVVDVNDLFSSGYGGSQTHLGTTFTAGQEGNIGFRLNGTNYGWMRVVFTGNTSGAVIKDWAYDNSGQAIVVGRITQSAPVSGAQTVTLSPDSGESFTLGSVISNTGGNTNSVIKTGAGTTILSQSNTYTGTTTVNAGKLVINGNISTSLLTTVNSGATLAGSGTVGATTVASGGTFAPGNSIGTITIDGDLTLGGISEFELNTAGDLSDLAISTAQITFGGTLNVTNTGSTLELGDTFNLFDWSSSSGTFSSINLPSVTPGLSWNLSNLYTNGQISVVPESSVALLGSLGAIVLLRRRRP